jgi:hypothetical protein
MGKAVGVAPTHGAFLRVVVLPDDFVEVTSVGGAKPSKTDVVRVSELPSGVLDKLSVLNMRTHTPPTEYVIGVGRRISEDVFWVFDEE